MNFCNATIKYLFVILAALTLSACGKIGSGESAKRDTHAGDEAAGFERGPHNGRLLRDGDLSVEVTIFETGVPPEFRIYVYEKDQLLKPAELQLNMILTRFAGVVDNLQFAAKEDYLVSTAEVYEPHSFDVAIALRHRGKLHRWTYASYEGRTQIDAAAANTNGIQTAAAGPGTIEERIALYGSIQPDATRVRTVVARFPGVIRTVQVAAGEQVRAGQALASVESDESLQTYTVTAPLAGTVVQRHANPGEHTAAETLFEIADYSQMWALLNVFPRDRARIQTGQAIAIRAADGSAVAGGTIAALGVGSNMPSSLNARVVLDNRNGQWSPDQYINAEVTVAHSAVPLVVPVAALQTFRDWDVVFLNTGEMYQAQPVTLGKRDGDNVEITAGLAAGMTVVVGNSYLVKADIEKAGASHDH